MSTDEFELPIKPKHPKTYIPLRADKVERGKSYASIMVNDQKTMLANLRWLRQQMDKEERQLKIMKDTLYDKSLPTRWTPYNKMEGFDRDPEDCAINCMPPQKHLPKNPSNLTRNHIIEYGKLHANVLVNDQIAMMENLSHIRRQMSKDDRQVDIFSGKKLPSWKNSKSQGFSDYPVRRAKSEFNLNILRDHYDDDDDNFNQKSLTWRDMENRKSVQRDMVEARKSMAREDKLIRKSVQREDMLMRKSVPREDMVMKKSVPREDMLMRKYVPREDMLMRKSVPRQDMLMRKSVPREDMLMRNSVPREDMLMRKSVPREDMLMRKSVPREDMLMRKSVPRELFEVHRNNDEHNYNNFWDGSIYRKIMDNYDFDISKYKNKYKDLHNNSPAVYTNIKPNQQNNFRSEIVPYEYHGSSLSTDYQTPDERVAVTVYERDNEVSERRYGLSDDGRNLLQAADMFCDSRSGKWGR